MATRRPTPRTAAEWGAVLPIYVGLSGIVACFVVWLVLDRVEPVLLGTFGTMIGVGQAADVLAALRSGPPRTEAADADGSVPSP